LGQRKGVTLLELLVTIGVVAIVVSITIPVLRSVGLKRHDIKNLTSLRSTHQQFREYANDHDDYFVNAGPPAHPGLPTLVDYGEPNGFIHMTYFGQRYWWPMVLATYTREGFPTWHSTHWPPPDDVSEPIVSGYDQPRFIAQSGFEYSDACISAPAMWRDGVDHNTDTSEHYRRVRWSETAHASSKGLLYDAVRPRYEQGKEIRTVVFVDGSAGKHDFLAPVASPPGAARRGVPVAWTPEGILGRDF
jgi:prepilin-type N-terminal cleavage/methylation domain-containing protein